MTVVNLDRSLNDEIDDAVRAVMLAVKELKSYRHLKARAITRDADGKPSGPLGELLDALASEDAALARAVGDLA